MAPFFFSERAACVRIVPVRLHAITSSSPRAPVREWVQAALLAANLAWTTLCLGGYRADTMVVTVALTAALVLAHAGARGRDRAAVAPHPAGGWLLPFLVYSLANVLWVTPVRWLGWIEWLGWAQMIAIFWVVLNGIRARGPQRALFFTLVLLGIVGVLLACYQRFVAPEWIMLGRTRPGTLGGQASGPFGIPNSFAGFLLLLLPATAALAFRRNATPAARVWWGWAAAVLGLGLVLTISRGAWMALAIALTVWPLAIARGGWWRRVRIAAAILAVVAVAGAAIYWKSPRVRARFTHLVLDAGEVTRPVMWRGAWALFRDAPVAGNGAASYNVLFERHRPEGFRDEPLWAHNEYLNTLADYGAVGFVLFFGACAGIAVRCATTAREAKPRQDAFASRTVVSGLGVGLLAFALQMGLDFHLKIPALAFAFATVAGLAVARAWPTEAAVALPPRRAPPAMSIAAASVALGAALWFFLPMLRAEGLRQQARRSLEQLGMAAPDAAAYARRLPAARAALARATELNPANAQAWADLAYATALGAVVDPGRAAALGKTAEEHASRALAVTAAPSEFWIRRGVARDMQGLWADASKDFGRAVAIAPADALAWYFYADHLSRLKWAREPAEAALAFCLRLDPGNQPGLALRQRLAIKPTGH